MSLPALRERGSMRTILKEMNRNYRSNSKEDLFIDHLRSFLTVEEAKLKLG